MNVVKRTRIYYFSVRNKSIALQAFDSVVDEVNM
jgi:hypothetical protein